MACRMGGFSSGSSNGESRKPWDDTPLRFLTAPMTVRGSIRAAPFVHPPGLWKNAGAGLSLH